MTLPEIARLLLTLGRLVGFAAAGLSTATVAANLLQILYHSPAWNFGFLPLVIALRVVVAACVVWGVLKVDARTMSFILLIFGIGSFGGLYGWIFCLWVRGVRWSLSVTSSTRLPDY